MVDLDTGEVYQKEAEFSHMSLAGYRRALASKV